jgi:DNA-binding response OmpR family regulator
VDDENDIRGLVRELLEQTGYDVLEGADSTEGLRLFYAEQPDRRARRLDAGPDGLGGARADREMSERR